MAKRKFIDNALIEKEDIDGVQDYREEVDNFIISDLLEYSSVFTGTNFQAVQQTVPNMTVKITAGVGMINDNYSELVTDGSVTINAAGAIARTDLITVTSALTDDTAEAKLFINPTTEVTYTDTVAMKERYVPTFHYYPSTSVVPGGEVGICTILVSPGDTSVTNSMLTDVRPIKDSSSLAAHIASVRATHANGSMDNLHIATNADIGTEKINGISVGTLAQLIGMNFSLNTVQSVAYDGDDRPITITQTGDHSWVMTITYSGDDVSTIAIEDSLSIATTTIVWVSSLPSTITTVVVDK